MYVNKWSQDRYTRCKRKKRKEHKNLTTSFKKYTHSPYQKLSYTNSPPKYKTTLIQNYSPFLSWMTKGKSLRGHHLVISRKASIIILITWSLWKRRWRRSETTKASLSTSNATDAGVHLTHLIGEIVKMSIHPLKLGHYGLQGHISCRRRRSRGGRSWKGGKNSSSSRIIRLHLWPLRSKLGLTLPNRTGADSTYGGEIKRVRNGMEKCWRIHVIAEEKMSLSCVAVSKYTSRIGVMKWERKSIKRSSRRDKRKWARGLVIEL